jgi:hypothetical protein
MTIWQAKRPNQLTEQINRSAEIKHENEMCFLLQMGLAVSRRLQSPLALAKQESQIHSSASGATNRRCKQ